MWLNCQVNVLNFRKSVIILVWNGHICREKWCWVIIIVNRGGRAKSSVAFEGGSFLLYPESQENFKDRVWQAKNQNWGMKLDLRRVIHSTVGSQTVHAYSIQADPNVSKGREMD